MIRGKTAGAALAGFALLGVVFGDRAHAGAPAFTLEDCVRYALEHSPLLDESRAATAVLEAKKLQADWAYFPKLDLKSYLAGPTSEARLAKLTPVGGGAPTRDPGRTGSVLLDDDSGDGELSDFGSELGVMWRFSIDAVLPIYTFGKIAAAQDAAAAGVRAARAQEELERLELIRDVRQTFDGYQAARVILSVLDEGEDKLAEAEDRVQESLDEDEDTYSEVDLFKLRVYGAELYALQAATRKAVTLAREGMKLLIGWPADRPFALAKADLTEEQAAVAELDELLGVVRRSHPAGRAITAGLLAAEELAALKLAGLFPDLYLAGSFGYSVDTAAQDIKHPYLSDNRNFSSAGALIGLRWKLDLPLQLGRYWEAEAEREKVAAQRRLALAGLSFQARESYLEVQRAADAVAAYRKARKAGRSWMVSATLNWGVGALDADDFIDALKAYSVGEIAHTRALVEYRKALADLSYRVGRDVESTSGE